MEHFYDHLVDEEKSDKENRQSHYNYFLARLINDSKSCLSCNWNGGYKWAYRYKLWHHSFNVFSLNLNQNEDDD